MGFYFNTQSKLWSGSCRVCRTCSYAPDTDSRGPTKLWTCSFHLNGILFGPLFTIQIHEAPLNYGLKGVPHGNLDILVVTSVSNTQMGILVIDGVPDQVLLTGSTKTEDSFDSLGSGEHVCVLWLHVVLLTA